MGNAIRDRLLAATRVQAAGRLAEAEQIYLSILKTHPTHPEALHLLGALHLQAGDATRAIELVSRAIAINSRVSSYHNTLGVAHKSLNDLSSALTCFAKAIEVNPSSATAHFNLADLRWDNGLASEAIEGYRNALSQSPNDIECHTALLIALELQGVESDEEIFQEHLRWASRHAEPLARHVQPLYNLPDPDRPLRIGYISPDFCDHVVSRFFVPLLENRDRLNFSTFCYANVRRPDHITQRIRAASDAWRDVSNMDDMACASQIRMDGIDILIDLAGHTPGSRVLVLGYKPAPIQITWLGYPDTTGMKAIDYRITDAIADPPGQTDHLHTERLLRLPQTAWCMQPFDLSPVSTGPTQQGQAITFGSFNNFLKLTEKMVVLWIQLLREVPLSRLLLKGAGFGNPSAREKIKRIFRNCGMSEDRLIIREPDQSRLTHLQRYAEVDIALDPFPYNGTTTTAEALWMGVPVITLSGRVHRSRVSASMLNTLGLSKFVAETPEQYVKIASDLAKDLPQLHSLRANLRAQMERSPLMDGRAFAKNMETMFRGIWQAWCSGSGRSRVQMPG